MVYLIRYELTKRVEACILVYLIRYELTKRKQNITTIYYFFYILHTLLKIHVDLNTMKWIKAETVMADKMSWARSAKSLRSTQILITPLIIELWATL